MIIKFTYEREIFIDELFMIDVDLYNNSLILHYKDNRKLSFPFQGLEALLDACYKSGVKPMMVGAKSIQVVTGDMTDEEYLWHLTKQRCEEKNVNTSQ